MDETSWKRLIAKIREEGNVVPIIGPRLLVDIDGQTSLQAQIAKRLMHDCDKENGEIALPPFRELNETVSRLREMLEIRKKPPQELYECVHEAIDAITNADGLLYRRQSASWRKSPTFASS